MTPDTEDYHQHNSCDRGHRPPRTHRNPISHVAAAAAAAVTAKVSRATHSTAAARSSGGNAKKSANPCSGPCDNCGARDSPQWRHGSKSKPIVCNACGIRFLRTGSFDKAVVSLPGSCSNQRQQQQLSNSSSHVCLGEDKHVCAVPNSSGSNSSSTTSSSYGWLCCWCGSATVCFWASSASSTMWCYLLQSPDATVPLVLPLLLAGQEALRRHFKRGVWRCAAAQAQQGR